MVSAERVECSVRFYRLVQITVVIDVWDNQVEYHKGPGVEPVWLAVKYSFQSSRLTCNSESFQSCSLWQYL